MAIVLLPAQVTGGVVGSTNGLTHSSFLGNYFTLTLYGGRPDNTEPGWAVHTDASSFSVVSGSLPPGLILQSGASGAAKVAGTPTMGGTYRFTIQATNRYGSSSIWWWTRTSNISGPAAQFTVTVGMNRPVITSAATAAGTEAQPFSYQITASNTPTSFNATSLPNGLLINTGTGVISGTPRVAGTFTVGLSATNIGGTGTSSLALTIAPAPMPPPVITNGQSESGMVGVAFSYQIPASNTPTSFNATSLPNGLLINTGTGVISGTPRVAGTFTVGLSATNIGGTGTSSLALTIAPTPDPGGPGSSLPRSQLEFFTDVRPSAPPVDNKTVQFSIEKDLSADLRAYYFRVNMAAQIRQGLFSTSLHTVELRGSFSGWAPIPGVLAPVMCAGATEELHLFECGRQAPYTPRTTANSTVYHFLVPLRASATRTLTFKFYATSPSLGWENIVGDRTYTPTPQQWALSRRWNTPVPEVNFNNAILDRIKLGPQNLSAFYLGNSAVSKIYHGGNQIFP